MRAKLPQCCISELPSATLAAALISAASPAPGLSQTATAADAAFTTLADTYYMDSLKRNPIQATFAGLHTYDAQMGDFSAAEVQSELNNDRAYLTKLQGIDRSALSQEVALDWQILGNSLNDDLLETARWEQWKHDPESYAQRHRLRSSASSRGTMRRSPPELGMSSRAKSRFRRSSPPAAPIPPPSMPPRIDRDHYVSGSAAFFSATVPVAFAGLHDAAMQSDLKAANATAKKAMLDYAAWIKALKPTGTFAIGADAYAYASKYEDGVDMSLADYLAVGQRELARLREQFVATAKIIDPNKSPMQVYQDISKDHPQADQLLSAAAGDLVNLRLHQRPHNIITLPPDANIKVVETTVLATTTASFDAPGPLETVATQTYYNVTPVDPSWSNASLSITDQQRLFRELVSARVERSA